MMMFDEIIATHPKSVSFDIFDSVLLRKIYPEDEQFILVAKKTAIFFKTKYNFQIDPYYLYRLRIYCRTITDHISIVNGKDGESRFFDIWLSVLNHLNNKYSNPFPGADLENIIKQIKTFEIETEFENLIPNLEIIDCIKKLRKRGIKIYFISDMYLSRNDIHKILKHFGIETLFDAGIVSSEILLNKGSGRLFKYIINNKIWEGYNPINSVHIGDNEVSDFKMPQKFGIISFKYNTFHHKFFKKLRQKKGEIFISSEKKRWYKIQSRKIKNFNDKYIKSKPSQNQLALFKIAETITPTIIKFLSFLKDIKNNTKEDLYFISSEAFGFAKIHKILFNEENYNLLPSANRLNCLRLYFYLQLKNGLIPNIKGNSVLFWVGEGKVRIFDFLKSFGIDIDYLKFARVNEYNLSDTVLYKELIDLICNDVNITKQITIVASRLLNELREKNIFKDKNRKIIFADLGWGGTINLFLSDILLLMGENEIKIRNYFIGYSNNNLLKIKKY